MGHHDTDLYADMDEFEGEHYLFADDAADRQNAISKCAQMAVEGEYKGFALFDGGKCIVSDKFKDTTVNEINELSGVDVNQTMSCGKGTATAYNVFQFPYIEFNKAQEEGLSDGEIAAIVLCSLVAVCCLGLGCLWFKRRKEGKPMVPKGTVSRIVKGLERNKDGKPPTNKRQRSPSFSQDGKTAETRGYQPPRMRD